MPITKRPKRPVDVVSNAVHMMKVLTGEAEDTPAHDEGKDAAAQAMGKKGGKARAESLTSEKRSAIAKKAAKARWEGI
jgi:hypothetical protein